ncbi:ArnT family glycosyltransferase [Xanthobacter oligotrophicus]|uniref:ArnT family glycosyltransferase n=1 Tax=Xanthobacter oligotrophicus TaxID=2607286 RepID=UPI0011F2066F|nr:glycosyltransferase family 39 protein [Xanthobacter oligotrophicus]MCG5236553.1 glycosyltransferase family 39 protein [Xanthobacter oligotrophicus]
MTHAVPAATPVAGAALNPTLDASLDTPCPASTTGLAKALPRRISPAIALLAILVGATVLRIAFAAATGLGNDESYTVVTSRAVAMSYFDHPPMAWWLARLSAWLMGSEAPAVVRAPFLVFSALSTFLMYRLTTRLFDPWAGVLAALMMACAPVLGVTSASWVLPDGPLIAFLLAATLVLARVLFEPDAHPAGWLLAGLLGGLAMLSKYHGVFFFAGTVLFLLTSPRHRFWLGRAWPYAGALVALAVVSPVVIWNIQNDFISLSFQASRAAAARFQPVMPLVVIGGIALFLTPWIWVGLVAAAVRAVRAHLRSPRGPSRRAARSWLLVCIGCGPMLLFPLVAAWSPAKPFFHWAAPGYLMLFPLLGHLMAQRWPRHPATRRWAFGSAIFVATVMVAVMVLAQVPTLAAYGPGTPRDPLRELATWSDLASAFQQQGLTLERTPFVVSRIWHEGGKVGYALGDGWPIACIGDDCRGFRVTHVEEDHVGDDAIIVVPAPARPEDLAQIRSHFTRLEPLATIDLRHAGAAVGTVSILIGRRYSR